MVQIRVVMALELNPCDYFLWGSLEDKSYNNNPHTIEKQKQFSAAVISISEETPGAVV
jgi:hypothetical protein